MITIVVATYNRPELLRIELESILASAHAAKVKPRILVVDDHSDTMAAKDVAYDFEVDYLRNKQNLGVARTLLAGFEQVDTPYYSFWGDDDYMLLNWFSFNLARIEEGYDVVANSYVMVDQNLDPLKLIELPSVELSDLKQGRVMANDGALVRTDSAVPFQPERERAMMMTFWLAMASADKRFSTITEPTWLYRRHKGQLSERKVRGHDLKLRQEAMAQYG